LRIVSGRFGDSELTDDELEASQQIRNVCAKVPRQLADEIDEVVGLLDISKRRFLEAAFRDAVQKARAIMEDEGAWSVAKARSSLGSNLGTTRDVALVKRKDLSSDEIGAIFQGVTDRVELTRKTGGKAGE
jgi:hypothetical protein